MRTDHDEGRERHPASRPPVSVETVSSEFDYSATPRAGKASATERDRGDHLVAVRIAFPADNDDRGVEPELAVLLDKFAKRKPSIHYGPKGESVRFFLASDAIASGRTQDLYFPEQVDPHGAILPGARPNYAEAFEPTDDSSIEFAAHFEKHPVAMMRPSGIASHVADGIIGAEKILRRHGAKTAGEWAATPPAPEKATSGSSIGYVDLKAAKAAVEGREEEILDAIGVPWSDRTSDKIDCPYPDHGGANDWRWTEKNRALCTCIRKADGSLAADSIFDVVGKIEGIGFEAAKIRCVEILDRGDLVGEPKTVGSYLRQDVESLLGASAEARDDALPAAYLIARLGIDPGAVLMPATQAVGIRALAYFEEARGRGRPKKLGDYPCAVFEQLDAKGGRHAHRIFLALGGAGKADLGGRDPKKSCAAKGERVAGRSVIWGDASRAELCLLVEGIETGAAVACAFRPEIEAGTAYIAAAVSAAGIGAFEPWPATKRVVVAADRDEAAENGKDPSRAGEKAARIFGAAVRNRVEVTIALPGADGSKTDWLDVLRADGVEAVRAGIEAAKGYVPTDAEIDPRPIVEVIAGRMPDTCDRVEQLLIDSVKEIYVRGEALVQPKVDRDVQDERGRRTTTVKTLPLGKYSLADRIGEVVRFQKIDHKGNAVELNVPFEVVETILSRADRWRYPKISGVITTPTLRYDGTLITKDGFDPESGLYLASDPDFVLPPIPEKPTRADAEAALADLVGLFGSHERGFPFVSEVDRSVALSGILTALVRGVIRTAPMHVFRAHTPGSGKTLLVELASVIATGHGCGPSEIGRTEEEAEKKISAILMDSDPIVNFDNLNGFELGGRMLSKFVEQPSIKIRILGQSRKIDFVNRTAAFATGNNLVVREDMVRRVMICTLDAGVERPETRDFDLDPIEEVLKDRGRYVAAAYTIIRAYAAAGRPKVCAVSLGSYGQWTDMVRAPLVWLGLADPIDSMKTAREEDPVLIDIGELFAQWDRLMERGVGYTTPRLIEIGTARTDPGYSGGYARPEFADLLARKAGAGGANVSSKVLGKWLSTIKGRVVNGLRLEMKADASHGSKFWIVAVPSLDGEIAPVPEGRKSGRKLGPKRHQDDDEL
jgi:hypothetical protein